jgi:hypothetical protein
LFNSSVIDVAIGLVFVFLLLSLICTAAHEIIEALMKARAANLERGIAELAGANSQDFVTRLYSHGLINSLFKGTYNAATAKGLFSKRNLPSYIPSKNFALALIDMKNAGVNLPQNIKDALKAFETVAGQDVAQLQLHIEEWYNGAMDRVSGWYKRRSQWIILTLGLAAAIAVNADCIDIAKRLSTDSNLRQSVERMAETTAKANPVNDQRTPLDRIKDDLASLDGIGLPMGWGKQHPEALEMVKLHWAGWLLTALAISLGAPFWFDMLNKIMVVRSTVKPSEKSGPEGTKDAKPAAPPPPAEDGAAAAVQGGAGQPGDGTTQAIAGG